MNQREQSAPLHFNDVKALVGNANPYLVGGLLNVTEAALLGRQGLSGLAFGRQVRATILVNGCFAG